MQSDQSLLSHGRATLTVCGLLFTTLASSALAQDRRAVGTATDRSLYPKAYGILANEKLMYPVDMSDWPLKIDATHQLFVDDYLLADVQHVRRTVHQAKKFSGNPIMKDHTALDGAGPLFPIVLRDERTGMFRMWYAGRVRYDLPDGTSVRFPALYAESKDGIHWTKPELGLHAFQGSKANNIVIPAGNLWGLHIDRRESNPQRRFKAVVWHEPDYVPREGYFLYTSPDGIHWTRATQEPIALSLHGYTMPQTGIGDTTLFRWDRHLQKYIGDVKFVLPPKMRARGFMESDDLIHWSRPRVTLYPDALDDADSQIYAQNSFCYESMWLGYLRMMHTERTPGYKQTTVELTASRDGRHWQRVGDRQEIIPLGAESDWDTDYHDPMWEPVRVGEELWIYYRSGKLRRDEIRRYDMGIAKLRRDGFVSLDAGAESGTVITRPLKFSGRTLYVNAHIHPQGSLSVAVLTRHRKPISAYATSECIPLRQGSTRARIHWKSTDQVQLNQGQHVRLQFQLRHAELYAFWIE